MGYILLAIYTFCLSLILIYSLGQGHLTFLYLRSKKKKKEPIPELPKELPYVTVQLPIFNELYVVERLLTKVAQLDYPLDRLEIQVLDDSTDETAKIALTLVEELQKTGLDIQHITRTERTGFKAGALACGLKFCKGEFVAIFDADFLPEKDFLLKTLPYFADKKIGLVQTKWEHLNQNFNLLTRLMSMALDSHFTIEQKGRNSNGDFMNFNGTAGIWRKTCINDSGGWSADTLTEDLDLSYRVQLKGWKMKYVEEFTSPAEIPAYIQAIRTQQYRWNKGGAEVARRNLIKVMKADIPFHTKMHALFHLLNTGIFICVFVAAVVSVPLLFFLATSGINQDVLTYAYVFFIGFIILSGFYWTSIRQRHTNALKATFWFVIYFPIFLSLSMGLSLYNSIAVMEGYLGIRSPFLRTPKFNIVGKKSLVKENQYMRSRPPLIALFEGLLAIYFAYAVYMGIQLDYHPFLPFHVLLTLGFSGITFYSLKHSIIRI
ncbi:MAG: glycosyltransferase family 2 protein [Flavobacteriales bacterium]|nr:glycosyltransferase family 2 protein [Flavobacteriales bacterium]